MRRILLAAAVLTAVAALGPRPANAHNVAPWCAVMNIGWGTVEPECSFWSLEECLPYALAGNRGFCEPNPAWNGSNTPRHRGYYRYRGRR